jgi:NADH:ubiquinone oxidoreductase subunit K
MELLILTSIVLFASAFLMVLPRSKGCLPGLIRRALMLAAVVVPFVLVYRTLDHISALDIVLLILAVALNVCAAALVGLGWQALLLRRDAVEDAADILLFDPTALFSTGLSGSQTSPDDFFGLILLFLLLGIVLSGLILAGFVEAKLLPVPGTAAQKVGRAALSFVYGMPIHVGAMLAAGTALGAF